MSVFRRYSQAGGAIHDLEHIAGLSSNRDIPLLLSERVLYVLTNLVNQDLAFECRWATELQAQGYQRLTTEDPEYQSFVDVVSEAGYQLRERQMLWEAGDIRLVSWAGQYGGPDPLPWIHCDGRAISRTVYADLFAIIGTAYGSGDGSTTFNIPDLRGRCPQGWDDSDPVGAVRGTKLQTLVPQHRHEIKIYDGTGVGARVGARNINVPEPNQVTEYTGEASGVDQRGPRLAMGWVIKT